MNTIQQIHPEGIWQFIVQGGIVTMTVAIILMVMSVASWYFIVSKSLGLMRLQRQLDADIPRFWGFASLNPVLGKFSKESMVLRIVALARQASEHHQKHAIQTQQACGHDEFLARNLDRAIQRQQAELESGLSVLASVGSVAPFVGLFGTVWCIYHALAAISASGQATLDKVAGPVGEALIMTAVGLAVAIPAVLAYNAFVKFNRSLIARLESFAQDIHTMVTTGKAFQPKWAPPSDNAEPVASEIPLNQEVAF